jgi:HTH-type transcriptional regulator/antitoxin MqsA
MPVRYRQFERQVVGLSGWECSDCTEAVFDPESAAEYAHRGDQLLEDAQQSVADEMRRIRRKLHLTQRCAVEMLSGGGHNAFSRYERAEVEPPKPLVVLMALLDRHPNLVEEVKAMGDGLGRLDLILAKEKQRRGAISP